MIDILGLSLRQLISRWRLLIMAFLAVLPVGLSAIMSALASDEPQYIKDFTDVIIDALIVSVLLPLVTMVLATMSFRHELDDRTLSYLALKPIPRIKIALPKILASVIAGGLLVISSGVISTLIGPESTMNSIIAVGVALLLGVITYTAIFVWAGLVSSHALGFALIYVFLWEAIVTSFLEGARYLSVRGYVLAIANGIDGERFESIDHRVIEFPAALILCISISVLFFWLTVRRLNRMDIP